MTTPGGEQVWELGAAELRKAYSAEFTRLVYHIVLRHEGKLLEDEYPYSSFIMHQRGDSSCLQDYDAGA
jgi:hypothetical protein